MLVIDAEECIDCGACEPVPVEAIFPEDALPDKWEPFVKINYAYPDSAAIDQLSSGEAARRADSQDQADSEPARMQAVSAEASPATLHVPQVLERRLDRGLLLRV